MNKKPSIFYEVVKNEDATKEFIDALPMSGSYGSYLDFISSTIESFETPPPKPSPLVDYSKVRKINIKVKNQ